MNAERAAILAVGVITDRVVPIDGNIGIRPMLSVTISCDHRVADGARGAAFLKDLAAATRDPKKSAELGALGRCWV